MPLYEYQCPRCGRFELIKKFSDEPLTTCPTCGSEVQKLLSAPAIQFKGTGWYITDYARKSSGGSEAKKDGAAGAKDTKDAKDTKGTKDTKDTSTKESGTKDSTSTAKEGSTPK